MPLLGPFDRPLPLRSGRSGAAEPRPSTSPVPTAPATDDVIPVGCERTAALARFVTRTVLGDVETVDASHHELVAVFTEDVEVWSPSFHRCGRDALISALRDRDDALRRIEVRITRQMAAERIAFTEWRLQGIFDRAGFVDDDVLVEPSHRAVESSGVLVCEFDGERVRSVRCYYDELGLMEGLLLAQ